jgi:hypothetical protein
MINYEHTEEVTFQPLDFGAVLATTFGAALPPR